MRQVRRWLIGLVAAALATASLLAGCGVRMGDGPVTLKVVAADYGSSPETSSEKYWNRLGEEFTRQNPDIRVEVTVIDWNEIDREAAAMIRRGDHPDILQTGSYAGFATAGLLYSADELLPIPVQADFITSLADAGQVHRVQYGIPFVSSSRLLLYNKDLFKRAGITKGPPRTWAELKSAAQKLKAAGVEAPYGLPLGHEEAQAEAMMWMLGGHGGYTNQVGDYTLDSKENIDTFSWLRKNLVETGLTQPDPARTDRQQVFDQFLQGKVGMLNGHPTLTGPAKEAGIDYGLARIPGRDGALEETLGVADWVMAFKKNGHREAIGKFLSFAYDQENTVRFLSQYDLLPVTASASELMRQDRTRKDLWPFLDKLPSAVFYPMGDPLWAPVSGQVKKEIGKAVEEPPEAVLGRLQGFAEREEARAGK